MNLVLNPAGILPKHALLRCRGYFFAFLEKFGINDMHAYNIYTYYQDDASPSASTPNPRLLQRDLRVGPGAMQHPAQVGGTLQTVLAWPAGSTLLTLLPYLPGLP